MEDFRQGALHLAPVRRERQQRARREPEGVGRRAEDAP